MGAPVGFGDDLPAQVGDGAVEARPAQVHTDNHKTLEIELEQRAAPSATPFGAALEAHKTFRDQLVYYAHYGGQAHAQALGDGRARNGAFPAQDFQHRGTVDFAHV